MSHDYTLDDSLGQGQVPLFTLIDWSSMEVTGRPLDLPVNREAWVEGWTGVEIVENPTLKSRAQSGGGKVTLSPLGKNPYTVLHEAIHELDRWTRKMDVRLGMVKSPDALSIPERFQDTLFGIGFVDSFLKRIEDTGQTERRYREYDEYLEYGSSNNSDGPFYSIEAKELRAHVAPVALLYGARLLGHVPRHPDELQFVMDEAKCALDKFCHENGMTNLSHKQRYDRLNQLAREGKLPGDVPYVSISRLIEGADYSRHSEWKEMF